MAAGAAWNRFGPANETGEARSPNTGSVSSLFPPDSIKRVLCPSQVHRSLDGIAGLAHVSSGLSIGSGDFGTRFAPPKKNSPMMGQELPFCSSGLTPLVL